MKTNTELVNYAKKALKEDWGYCLGTYGQVLTRSLLNQKKRQGYGVGKYNTRHSSYLEKRVGGMVSDCYGLVKGCVWKKDSKGSAIYNASQDRNQEGAYRAAKEKGPISNIPEIPGLVLWMKGHAGIYIGNGEFIECVGIPVGMRKGKIVNGRVTKGSKFTHWFKDTYINYTNEGFSINKPINSLKVGRKVKVRPNAKKYATGQTIPSNVKGKLYTVQQVKKDRALLKEIYSWVFIKDLEGYKVESSSKKLVVDGKLGPDTIKALQRALGTPVDGIISNPSVVIKELQRKLNKGEI